MTVTEEPRRRSIAPGMTALSFADAEESVSVGKGFAATVNGLVVEGSPRIEAWEAPGKKLRVLERGAQFAIGDFANELEARFGEAASQILDAESGWNLRTLSVYRWVASRIAHDIRRMDRLGIGHHLIVAALTPAKQRQWLTAACADDEEQPWSKARLKKALEANEDLPISGLYILVGPMTSGQVQADLMERLEHEGLLVKAIAKRQRRAQEPEA